MDCECRTSTIEVYPKGTLIICECGLTIDIIVDNQLKQIHAPMEVEEEAA